MVLFPLINKLLEIITVILSTDKCFNVANFPVVDIVIIVTLTARESESVACLAAEFMH